MAKRGLANVPQQKREEISRKGGLAIAAKTNMAELGRKGGLAPKTHRRKTA